MAHFQSQANFWSRGGWVFDDVLNIEIWQKSPKMQADMLAEGIQKIDAQQAMVSRTPLPWVPDLLGRDWLSPNAVMIVGSSYAGFVAEFSKRSGNGAQATISLKEYADTANEQSPERFQRCFLRSVVEPDIGYYGRLQRLIQDIYKPSEVSLLDLCRASFVERKEMKTRFVHKSGDSVVKKSPARFQEYLDRNADWTYQRILRSKSNCIVALGTIAEHGLLRLFVNRGMEVQPKWVPKNRELLGAWVNDYAHQERNLSYWIRKLDWWRVADPKSNRAWNVLPVYHPSASQKPSCDPNYQRTRGVLSKMRTVASK